MKFNKMLFFLLLNLLINQLSSMNIIECEMPKYCESANMQILYGQRSEYIICSIKGSSQLRFDLSKTNQVINQTWCDNSKLDSVFVKPGLFESNIILSRKSIDIKSFVQYILKVNPLFSTTFESFKGYDLDFYDESDINITVQFVRQYDFKCRKCLLRFYQGEKQMRSCQDYYNLTKPARSIFHFFSNLKKMNNGFYSVYLTLAESKDKICPLAFNNLIMRSFNLFGENSYFSRRVIEFSNDTFDDLNTDIYNLEINIGNVEIGFGLVHPSVFKKIRNIFFNDKVKSISEGFFLKFKSIKKINFKTPYFRSLIHHQGIEWIKDINSGLDANLSDPIKVNEFFENKKPVNLVLDCISKTYYADEKQMSEIFPDEDFCVYREFPFNQLVIPIRFCPRNSSKIINPGCTFLWLIQYYNNYNFTQDFVNYNIIQTWINIKEFKSISKCNFEHRIALCNRSNFHMKSTITYFEISESMKWTKYMINMTSYLLCIFGIVSNLLVIITISSKKNKSEFKEFNQYKYMRISAICSCLILSIHFMSWLNECDYPFQIFCLEVRKTLFLQYLKIIVGQLLATSLRFFINFSYIAFSFCRLALVGNEHNKLVKFMSEMGIKKYVSITLLISSILSVIKYFSYRINYGIIDRSYPIDYDYESMLLVNSNKIYFIISFVSDLLNYFVFLLIHLSLDIVMVIKFRKTLNDQFEKLNEYSTKEQQENRKIEHESAFNKAIYMVILNSVFGVLLKFPTCVYSLIFMYFNIYKKNKVIRENSRFFMLFHRACIYSHFCDMLSILADFLYLLHISIQLFFYLRFDKKFKIAFDRIFSTNKN